MTKFIINLLNSKNYQLDVFNVADITKEFIIPDTYDTILLCTSTWGIDTPTLQEDFDYFWKKLNKDSIKDKKFIIIGAGDNYYPHFCAAVDILNQDITKYKGTILQEGLKIQDPWEESKNLITNYIDSLFE